MSCIVDKQWNFDADKSEFAPYINLYKQKTGNSEKYVKMS